MGILTLDLSKWSTGWAFWQPGWELPRYGSWQLGSEYTSDGGVFAKLHRNLSDMRKLMPFESIYHEEAINAANLGGMTNIRSLRLAAGLAAHVDSFAYAKGCRVTAINISSWRKEFLSAELVKDTRAKHRALAKAKDGKSSASAELKNLTIERCRALGMKPQNNDQADAIGILDYALEYHEHVTVPWRAGEIRLPIFEASQ